MRCFFCVKTLLGPIGLALAFLLPTGVGLLTGFFFGWVPPPFGLSPITVAVVAGILMFGVGLSLLRRQCRACRQGRQDGVEVDAKGCMAFLRRQQQKEV